MPSIHLTVEAESRLGNGGTEEITNNNMEGKGRGIVDSYRRRNENAKEENNYISASNVFLCNANEVGVTTFVHLSVCVYVCMYD